ncbi:mannitol-1-phosphate 5-dehydrogenase [Lysinibacillus sp. KU-BSD001]|uniref:mannitol-1-phosphate 5-dehydrogenase n=1 Tax=Lysinibacillus sp. KU-BSD001 TaxID=3141328 RepID=UPI0036E0705F
MKKCNNTLYGLNITANTRPQKPQAVHFGAGNIGRGFIGLLLTRSGYDVTFITRNKTKITQLQQRNEYPVNIANENNDRILVRNVTAISSQNKNAIAKQIAKANLITTAVGVANLSSIASKIALGIRLRLQTNDPEPLHIIACENGINSSTKLQTYIYEHLPEELHEKASHFIAFPNTAVDRIVPTLHHEDPLEVTIEPYYEWVIDRSAMLEGLPHIKGVQFVDSLEAFIERKLFTVNTGHCSIAYLGYLNGYSTIQEVMTDPQLATDIKKVMQETGNMLVEKHDFDETEHTRYIHKTLNRFANPYLSDEIVRIGRSPIRKLSINDRLVRPTILTYNLGLDVSNLTNTLAAALLYDHDEDPEAVELKKAIQKHTIHDVIAKYLGIPRAHPLHQKVAQKYREFKQKYALMPNI